MIVLKKIPLACGKSALISPCDYESISRMKWSTNGAGYVRARWKRSIGGDGRIIYMHRFIMNPPPELDVDHIDGDPLNNTRENLQILTQSRNLMKAKRKWAKGITYDARTGKWRVRIRTDCRMIDFGSYDTEADALTVSKHVHELIWEDPKINATGAIRA